MGGVLGGEGGGGGVLGLLGGGGGDEAEQQPYGGVTAPQYASSGSQYYSAPSNSLDFSGPGAAEQTFASSQAQWAQPSASSQYATSAMPAIFSGNTNSQNAFNQFQAGEHDFSPYFDRAKTRALGSMNDQAAARGAYGSSAALSGLGETSAALEAERANREATYNLQRGQLAGQLGAGADSANMQRFGLGGSLAGQSDQYELSRLGGMMNAASMAQGAQRQRGRDYMQDIWAPTAMGLQLQGQAQESMLAEDQAFMDAIAGLELAAASEGLTQSQYLDALVRGDLGSGNAAMWQVLNARPLS